MFLTYYTDTLSKNFDNDLKIGECIQDVLIKRLGSEFPGIHAMEGEFPDYDLECSGYTFEVKFDYKSRFTNNTAIEYRYKNKPSGISHTKAIEWLQVFYIGKWVYSRIGVSTLKAYITSNWGVLDKVSGGDGGKSDLILIPKNDFANAFDFIGLTAPLS